MILPVAIAAFAMRLGAQASVAANYDQSLKIEIARMDSVLFVAVNARDLARLETFFAPDLEFYQDNEGLENYSQTIKILVKCSTSPRGFGGCWCLAASRSTPSELRRH
jgi:hypothetical protein